MGVVGALAVNVGVAVMLYAYREGDANMRSVWLCSRNDAIGNIAVIMAAMVVGWTNAGWPDAVVAIFMGTMALCSGQGVVWQARKELTSQAQAVTPLGHR